MMGTGIPIDHMNEKHLKKMLESHKDELATLAAMNDEDIDFSDMPELTVEDWRVVVRELYFLSTEQRRALQKQMSADSRSNRDGSAGDKREG